MGNAEKLERVENEIYWIEEAMDFLSAVRDMDIVMDMLKDRLAVLGFEKEQYHRLVEQEDARDEEALRREYFAAR